MRKKPNVSRHHRRAKEFLSPNKNKRRGKDWRRKEKIVKTDYMLQISFICKVRKKRENCLWEKEGKSYEIVY